MKKTVTIIILLICSAMSAGAQRLSVSSNLADPLWLGTLNAGAEYGFSGHWAVEAGGRYNNWNFRCDCDSRAFQDRRRSLYAGPRYWFRDTCQGIWTGVRFQIEEYNRGGLFGKPETEEGNAAGIAFGLGFSHWLNKRLRLDAGAFFWAGGTVYSLYAAPRCGRCLVKEGRKGFVRYDSAIIALSYTLWESRNSKREK